MALVTKCYMSLSTNKVEAVIAVEDPFEGFYKH